MKRCLNSGEKNTCNGLHIGDDFGCLHGSCSGTCNGHFERETPSTARYSSGGYVNLNQPFAFVTSQDEAKALFDFNPTILQLDEIQEGLTLLQLHYAAVLNGNYSQDSPSKTIAANFYGNLVGLTLPEAYLETLNGYDSFKEVVCNCQSDQPGCKLVGNGNSGVWICSGDGCSKCAMTVKDEGTPTD